MTALIQRKPLIKSTSVTQTGYLNNVFQSRTRFVIQGFSSMAHIMCVDLLKLKQ